MNEKNVIKRSFQIFLIGCLLFGIIGIGLKNVSYLFGFILGYVLNLVIFNMIIKMSEGILTFSMSTVIVIVMFIAKLLVYSLGFFIAVKSNWFHLLGVFVGYMVTKISIYVEGYINKGGDVNA